MIKNANKLGDIESTLRAMLALVESATTWQDLLELRNLSESVNAQAQRLLDSQHELVYFDQ